MILLKLFRLCYCYSECFSGFQYIRVKASVLAVTLWFSTLPSASLLSFIYFLSFFSVPTAWLPCSSSNVEASGHLMCFVFAFSLPGKLFFQMATWLAVLPPSPSHWAFCWVAYLKFITLTSTYGTPYSLYHFFSKILVIYLSSSGYPLTNLFNTEIIFTFLKCFFLIFIFLSHSTTKS